MAIENKWRSNTILTMKEGYMFEDIMAKYGCANVSQFCKKIVHGEIPLPSENEIEMQAKLAQYERILADIKKLLP